MIRAIKILRIMITRLYSPNCSLVNVYGASLLEFVDVLMEFTVKTKLNFMNVLVMFME